MGGPLPRWGRLDAGEDLERLRESLQSQRPWLGHVLSLHSAAGIMLWGNPSDRSWHTDE